MNTNLNIDLELGILEKYQLSISELFVATLVLMKQDGYDNYLERYAKLPESIRGNFRGYLLSMQNKGIILKSCEIPNYGIPLNIFKIKFSQNFVNTFHRSAGDLGAELWEMYPQTTVINGVTCPIKNISKKFDSLEDFYRFYGKTIKWNAALHKEILELLQWAKDNTSCICMSISSFVIEHKWELLRELKDGKLGNINYNNVKLV